MIRNFGKGMKEIKHPNESNEEEESEGYETPVAFQNQNTVTVSTIKMGIQDTGEY